MGKTKRYYWLKLEKDFFRSKAMKKLRRQAGGSTYMVIVLELALISLEHDGIITYEGLDDTVSDEIALELDEESDDVRVVLAYLQKCGWLEVLDDDSLLLKYAVDRTGTEAESAARMRRLRARENQTSLCDAEPSQCDGGVTPLLQNSDDRVRVRDKSKEYREKRESVEYTPAHPANSCTLEESGELSTEISTGDYTTCTTASLDTSKIKGAIGYYSLVFGDGECPVEVQNAMVNSGMSNQDIVEFMKSERDYHEEDMGTYLVRTLTNTTTIEWL